MPVMMIEWSWLGLGMVPLLGILFENEPDDDQNEEAAQPENPDLEMVRAVQAGDATAYRGLVERYQGRIYAVCYGMVRNREDARDLAQESFVKAYKSLDRFRLESSFYTWICRIAMNVSIDHLRRKKVRRAQEYDDGIAARDSAGVISLSHHRNDPHRDLHRKQLREKIMAALETLPEDQKQAVVLREMDGLSYKEIAEIMGIPEGTVMSRLFYARKKLREVLTAD